MRYTVRRRARAVLGVDLPNGVRDVHAYRWAPSSDLPYHQGYVRFDAPPPAFRTLLTRLGLADADASHPLATSPLWELPDGVALDWWDASSETPSDAVVADRDVNGWIAVKRERGHVYVVVTGTGAVTGTPGPW